MRAQTSRGRKARTMQWITASGKQENVKGRGCNGKEKLRPSILRLAATLNAAMLAVVQVKGFKLC